MVFQGKRNPINVLFTVGILCTLLAFKAIGLPWMVLDFSFLFLFGFFIFGPQMLIGVAATELSHKKAAATATGFAGCFAYLGAAMAGGPLGALMKVWGWDSYFLTLGVCAVLGIFVMLPLWSVKTNVKEEKLGTAS
jgi:OPA family sugar phosphate sensor protein UhpC-like MFS transporter